MIKTDGELTTAPRFFKCVGRPEGRSELVKTGVSW